MTDMQKIISMLLADDRITSAEECAYILATVRHETAGTYRPIKEYGLGKGHKYGLVDPSTGQAYYGRGYVQLTWKFNYKTFSDLLGIDLINDPDLALVPETAYEILVVGMLRGLFTGKRLGQYVNEDTLDFKGARKVINGTDKAALIAKYATEAVPLFSE